MNSIVKSFLMLFFILAFSSCLELDKLTAKINAIQIEDIDLSEIKNGEYESASDYTLVSAKVRVTVLDGKITAIRILEHGHGPFHGAEAITNRVLEKQSLKVDAVSGATGSSKVILKTVENALVQGNLK